MPPAQQHRPERGGHQPHQRQFRTVETVEEPPRDDPAVDRDEPRGREGRGQQKRRRLLAVAAAAADPLARRHQRPAEADGRRHTERGRQEPLLDPVLHEEDPRERERHGREGEGPVAAQPERQRRNPPGPFGPCPVGRRQIAGGRPRQAGFGPSGLARLSRLGQRRHGRTPGADPGPHGLDHVGRRPLGLRQRLCARRLGRSRSRSRQSRLERCLELRHPGREAALAQGQNQRRDGRGQQDSG
ncbi:hypothetical protein CESP606_15990 [Cereibacter sphaeroides]